MPSYAVRTDLSRSIGSSFDQLLDWRPGDRAATVQVGPDFFEGAAIPRNVLDLLVLGGAVYCVDKIASRSATADAWTRNLEVHFPVKDTSDWINAPIGAALSFLTGDKWRLDPYDEGNPPIQPPGDNETPPGWANADAVCLFSGGLDSLCGAIDLLERGETVVLIGHHEGGGQESTAQQRLSHELAVHYGEDRVELHQLFLRPSPPSPYQEEPLPGVVERTTRGRSLLFISAGLAIASAIGRDCETYVPENGFIGINVPLTRARRGTLSTRTTHPHFISLLGKVADAVEIPNPLKNPFRLATKGEVLASSSNLDLLKRLAPMTISCSHPEAPRWRNRPQGNCGYCFPCLIRRAAMAVIDLDQGSDYAWDVLSEKTIFERRDKDSGADLRALVNAVVAKQKDSEVLRHGPLPPGERRAFLDVWTRGIDELRRWLARDSTGLLHDFIRNV